MNLRFKMLMLVIFTLFFREDIPAQLNTIPGTVTTPYPTLMHLGIEWVIKGDDNQNGIVAVFYRKKGSMPWQKGMPLRRVPADSNKTTTARPAFTWNNKHSGSLFDLSPNTAYEIKLQLHDPDGGDAERLVFATTRPVPEPGKNAKIIEIAPGFYDSLHTISGTAASPVVYRCSSGSAVFRFIDMTNREWVFVEQLVVKNDDTDGKGIQLNGAKYCVVRYCSINAVYGIVAYLPGATNCYFSDNTITGICSWSDEAMGAEGKNIGEGIQITGSGNVICFNAVKAYRDCISFMEDEHAAEQTCNDIYNNNIDLALDDGIEADFCTSNCRIMRNQLTNCYVGLSSQPGLGGPTYFIRNVMYNIIHAAFKLKRFSRGDVVLHNTVIKIGAGLGGNSKMDHAYFRNNLAFGGPDGEVNWGGFGAGLPSAANIIEPGKHSSFDYDAVGVEGIPYKAFIGDRDFRDIEPHGVENILFSTIFNQVRFPVPLKPVSKIPDLRLKKGARAIDAALLIPNINDRFTGNAPDCGAYEFGYSIPHYGPRVEK